jgi:hypothetical protein
MFTMNAEFRFVCIAFCSVLMSVYYLSSCKEAVKFLLLELI